LLVSANREQLPSLVMPIGVLSVAAATRDAGAHAIEVLDLCFEDDPFAALSAAIARVRPEAIGLGVRNLRDNGYTREEVLAEYHAALGRTIRAATDAPVILGGAAVTLKPRAMLERVGATHAVVGEGERAFPALLDALARGERPEAIVQAKPAALDDLPRPALTLADPRYAALEGTVPVQTKRGCPFHCAYCDYPDLEGRAVRMRAPAEVARDFARLADEGAAHVFIVDSVFNAPPAHARAICDALIAQGNRLPWSCYASPAGLDDALVAKMAAAGCVGVEIGTDAGTEAGLRRLRKPFDLAAVRRVRASFRAHGLADCHSFVLGAEGETPEEAMEALAFVEALDPDVAVFLVFAEDREARADAAAAHRAALLELLAREAPKRPGWIAPQLGVRFGPKVTRLVRQRGLRGPAWLHLAEARRRDRA
jgi:hypothetical protein